MAADLSKYEIKEIYLNEIIDNDTGETVAKFNPPALWWEDDGSEKKGDNE